MFALYQSNGLLYAVAETIDGCLASFEGYLADHPAPLGDDGRALGAEDYLDFTSLQTPGLEVPGELYLRRCTLALFAASTEADVPLLPYGVQDNGIVTLNR